MSAADSARKRAHSTVQELLRDAVSIRLDLTRLINDLAEEGSCLGTKSLVEQMAVLDRKVCYLKGLREGLDTGAAG